VAFASEAQSECERSTPVRDDQNIHCYARQQLGGRARIR
jgi:hypothetical protein